MTDKIIQELTSALIGILAVVGAFLIAFYQLTNGRTIQEPDFVALLIGAVVGSYLTRVASVNGARQAGIAAGQVVANQSAARSADAASTRTSP